MDKNLDSLSIPGREDEELFNFLTENGSITLLDYIFLEKLFLDYEHDYEADKYMEFANCVEFDSEIDGGKKKYYASPALILYYENPIYSCFISSDVIISRLHHYKKLKIIDFVNEKGFIYLRFSDRATIFFKRYISTVE